MFGIGFQEMIIIRAIGVLLFGKRLPEVGRSVGKSLMEFKRGMQGIESEIHTAASSSDPLATTDPAAYEEMADDYEDPSTPKFEPPTTPPSEESNTEV